MSQMIFNRYFGMIKTASQLEITTEILKLIQNIDDDVEGYLF